MCLLDGRNVDFCRSHLVLGTSTATCRKMNANYSTVNYYWSMYVQNIKTCTTEHDKDTFKGPFTPSESRSESEKDERTSEKKKDRRINDKYQRKCSRLLLFSLSVNWPLRFIHTEGNRTRKRNFSLISVAAQCEHLSCVHTERLLFIL